MKKIRKNKKDTQPLSKIESVQLTAELIQKEIRSITKYAQRGVSKVITLGDFLLFFSTSESDAWLLDTQDKLALQLMDQGAVLPYRIMESENTFSIEWKTNYEIIEKGFAVKDKHGNIRLFPSYPFKEIQNRLNDAAKYPKIQIDKR